jgi:hypothetical protein
VEWTIKREGLPDWTVVWSILARARLRNTPREKFGQPYGPDPVFESIRIKPGVIVFRKPRACAPENATENFLKSRYDRYDDEIT